MNWELVDIENRLGVTFTGWSEGEQQRLDWPMDIDVRWATRELHTMLPQILLMTSVTGWQARCAYWLLDKTAELKDDPALEKALQKSEAHSLLWHRPLKA